MLTQLKDFLSRNASFLIVTLVTLGLIVGGVLLFTKNPTSDSTDKKQIASNILDPEGSQATGGIVDGEYVGVSRDPNTKNITIVEFGDYQCPACGAYEPLIESVLTTYADQIKFVFRNFPLPQHANGNISSYAAISAGYQGKFWEMHHLLYQNQKEWSDLPDATDLFVSYANKLGLDEQKFREDLESKSVKDKVATDLNDGKLAGVNSTPTFFIQGVKINNPRSEEEFLSIVKSAIESEQINQSSGDNNLHAHYDLAIYINGAKVDLSQDKYQETEDNELNEYAHLHDRNGNVVHMHKKKITLKELIDSLKLSIPKDNETNNVKVYVNGKLENPNMTYIPNDLDEILVSYGPKDEDVKSQLESVSDDSCIYSEVCPERGTPPEENCVGGLGTGCTSEE